MSPTSTARHRRVARQLTISAAALALCLLPTACDFGGVPAGGNGGGTGNGGGYGAPADPTSPPTVVVPVGNNQPGQGGGGYGNGGQNGGQQPGGGAEQPGGGEEQPGGGEEQPGGGEEQPGGGEEQPGGGAEQPGGGAEQPGGGAEQPGGGAEQPGGGAEQPGGGAEQPGGGEEQPGGGQEQPGGGAEQPGEEEPPAEEQPPPPPNNGLDVLGQSCADSDLPAHTGFQSPDAQCVQTSMGEVAPENQLPSLLITEAPTAIGVGEGFQLQVSTRNLVRDRFLGAAAGGYYLEMSFLNDQGLQRGHFHTACRFLPNTNEAPDSSGAPAFFLATQDNQGGSAPDTVTIDVPAASINQAGTLQCTSWAGDGSHRTPMMSRANQTPAIDSVRIEVGGQAEGGNNDNAGDNGDNAGGNAGDAGAGDEAAGDAGAGDGGNN